ncbi:MAG: glutathione S-transferase family protein [Burkholderiales bacterium]
MPIRLYYAPGACSFIPHVGLELAAAATGVTVEFELVKLHKGEHRTPEYMAINPNAQVPTLVVDGRPLNQILAICDWIASAHPAANLLPADPWSRAQMLSSLAWMNNTVHTTFTHVFMPGKFTDDADAQAKVKASAAALYRTQLERIQGWLDCARPWLAGESPSFVDAYALTLFRWGGFAGIDPATLPAYRDYVLRLAQHPAVAAAMAREKLSLDTYKPA